MSGTFSAMVFAKLSISSPCACSLPVASRAASAQTPTDIAPRS